MVKRRETPVSLEIDKKIENFVSKAENYTTTTKDIEKNQDSKRDYKAIRVPFNQYEYELLEKLCKDTNRSKLNMIRYALIFYNENQEK